MKPKRWVPAEDENFWAVTGRGTEMLLGSSEARTAYAPIGNCFKTFAEANAVAADFREWMLKRTEPK